MGGAGGIVFVAAGALPFDFAEELDSWAKLVAQNTRQTKSVSAHLFMAGFPSRDRSESSPCYTPQRFRWFRN